MRFFLLATAENRYLFSQLSLETAQEFRIFALSITGLFDRIEISFRQLSTSLLPVLFLFEERERDYNRLIILHGDSRSICLCQRIERSIVTNDKNITLQKIAKGIL